MDSPQRPQKRSRFPPSPGFTVTRTPTWHLGQRCMTFDTWIGASLSRIPPCRPAPRGLVCRLMKFTFSTMTRPLSRSTLRTRPDLPRSSPEITTTWSFLLKFGIVIFGAALLAMSDHLRSQRDDLHELPLAKLARHGAEDARPLGLFLVVDQHGGVLVESNVAAVLAAHFLPGPDQDRLVHVALLHGRARKRVLDGNHDHVPEHAVALPGAAQDLHDPRDPSARIVRYGDDASRLYHGSFRILPALSARRAERSRRDASACPCSAAASP